ncbi:MAG TPA: T9SS type A sorting domain-containing protein [Fluviicola sp.]|nr:T9SS type A sorting domain-containing protein [Fluviicola sp.]
MKKALLVLLAIANIGYSSAQFSYSFTATTGTYTANATPTTLINSGVDDNISASTPIGFNFVFGCTTYTTFTASSNGWIGLGGAAFYSEAFNSLSTTFDRPKIAPLWDDLATGSAGNVNYKLTGTAPNRILTVEWKEMEWRYTASVWALSFQCKLYETSNRIEFIYTRNGNATANTDTPDASIGLSGAGAGEFYSLNGTGGSPTASNVTETSTLNSKPANGQIYGWDNTSVMCSGTPTGGTSSASPASTSCATLTTTLTGAGMSTGCGLSYQWQSSPNNSTWTNIAGATSATYVATNSANTYYRLVTTCSNSGLSANGASTLVSFTGTTPVNDLPCNATAMTIGVSASGTNECAGSASEPTPPACWYNGSVNTVWYSVTAPASGTMKIKTTLLSSGTILQNTQIAVYSGTCGSLTYVNCNNDAPTCGGYTPLNSELSLTGLTPGATYFIAVDGYYDQVGQFEILAIDGSATFPLVPGQDCGVSFPVCNSTMTIGNPGYQSIGGQCDNTGAAASECTSGEANAVWYNMSIASAGTLNFDIIPNDYGNPNPITGQANAGYTSTGDETDYDWVLWKLTGSGSTTCALIMSSGGNASSACNFSYLGVTGCSSSGNAPAAYGAGFDGAYEIGPAVVAGETYVLAIHNYSNSTSGFTLQFPSSGSPVAFTPTTTLYWTGGANTTSATTSNNWGGCGIPTCGLNAVVTSASSFQPVLTPGTYNVNDITINAGSTLTIQSGATLNVCGNFTNNGNLVCQAGSTVVFVGSGTQNITGSFVGVDGFHHLTINKTTGTVVANNNVDIKGNFLTNNGTSIFNANSKYIKVGGNFTNNNGNTTYTNTGSVAGTLEFFGSAAQTYNQGASQLDLNFVVMNHSGPGVDLATNMFIKATTGSLTLTNGKINTAAFRVDVANGTPACVTTGNTNSYINGNLYRTLSGAAGSYDFPLGTATLYERANINFTTATTIPRLQSRFDSWGTPANHINGMSECATTYNLLDENMGFWTINASANPTSGTYNTTLYCTGATNTAGVAAWTVEKSQNSGATWILSGTCDPTSTAAIVKRNGMNGFSLFAAAQATNPLPVELLGFYGYEDERINYLKWTTASEINSDYFDVERSKNGIEFYAIDQVDAAGNSNQEINYTATDENPYYPVTYYRVKQVDIDGDYYYTPIIAIESSSEEPLTVHQVYPNPTKEKLYVEFSLQKSEHAVIAITDISGKVIHRIDVDCATSNVVEFNSKQWLPGMYLIRITTDSGLTTMSRVEKL